MVDSNWLFEQAKSCGVVLVEESLRRFERYAQLLVEWNEKMNLTAITDPSDIIVKHFADSLTVLPLLPDEEGTSLIDVGTGAGFPAIPLLIARPDLQMTLLDSLGKRLVFLEEVCRELGLKARTVHMRAEDGAHDAALREQFDVATARAVAALPLLSEYCLPYVKCGGRFIAMKGPESDGEVTQAGNAIALLGGGEPVCHATTITAEGETLERRLFVIEKQKATPAAYPRSAAKIKKDGAL